MPYPTELDDLPVDFKNETDAITGIDDPGFKTPGEGEHAKRHNRPADSVNRMQLELGLEPSGEHDDVAERLAAMDLVLGSTAAASALAAEVKAREEAVAAKATKAEVTAAIAKVIGGAPEALDTLKEVYDTLKAAEESDDAAMAALTGLIEGKATAAALTAETKAREEGDAGKAALIHAARHQLGGADALALPQYDPYDLLPYIIPMGLTPGTTQTPLAKRAYFTRFTVSRKRGFKFVRVPVGVVGTGEDKVDVAIYRVNGAKLERLSSNGGVKVNFTVVGMKVIELGIEVVCEPNVVYFVASAQETVTGTPQMLTILNNNGSVGDGGYSGSATAVSGSRLMLIKNEAFPLPAEVTAVTSSSPVTYVLPSEI